MDINGKATVWAEEHESEKGKWYTYKLGISGKKKDEKLYTYLPVRFVGNPVINNRTYIDVKEGFLSVDKYNDRNGKEVKYIMAWVKRFEIISEDKPDAPQGFAQLVDNDIPFR